MNEGWNVTLLIIKKCEIQNIKYVMPILNIVNELRNMG